MPAVSFRVVHLSSLSKISTKLLQFHVIYARLFETQIAFCKTHHPKLTNDDSQILHYLSKYRLQEARNILEEFPHRDQHGRIVHWTSLLSKVGSVEEGYCLFRRMPERNIVSWTAMIGGFTWNSFYKEALLLFLEMSGCFDIKPNVETFISLAYACTGLGYPRLGMQLHAQLIINCWAYDDYDGRLSRSLIHMYSTFGMMDCAHYIFLKNLNKCIVQSYNSMINGYIRIGQLEKAENLFDMVPIRDKISCTSMINGYLSFGQVLKAHYLFYNMPERDAVAWTAMISGHVQNELFAEATYLFSEMRAQGVSPLNSTYSVLLGATAKRTLELDPLNAAAHVVLCNIYAANGQHVEETMLRKEMKMKGVRKVPGCSWIMLKGKAHMFLSGDRLHSQVNDMLSLLYV
ncbi:pentatricopeptide repeat-containing protein At1g32415, mitochondrial isoform X2 [Fagus crenata]